MLDDQLNPTLLARFMLIISLANKYEQTLN